MKFLVLFFSFVFSGLIFADDHQDSGPFYAFYHLQVTNPASGRRSDGPVLGFRLRQGISGRRGTGAGAI